MPRPFHITLHRRPVGRRRGIGSLLAACLAGSLVGTPVGASDAIADPGYGAWGIDLSTRDLAVDPGDDFFRYVNGAWLADFDIPADHSNYGAFTRLQELSQARVRMIVDEAVEAGRTADDRQAKIAAFHTAYTDRDGIEARGLRPARPALTRILMAEDHGDIAALMADPQLGIASPVSPYIYVDFEDPERYLLHVSHGGLGMPNRDFYLEPAYAKSLAAYREYVADMLRISRTPDAGAAADRIVALETEIAKLHWPMAHLRDPQRMYNRMSRADFTASIPDFPWQVFERALGMGAAEEIVVNQPDALAGLARLFAATPVETWKDYLRFHYLSANADVLPQAYVDRNFAFYGTELQGQLELPPLWRRGVEATSASLSDLVGQIYVERHFPPGAKAEMERLIANVRDAFGQRIRALDWMSEATKAEAIRKLAGFRAYIGYPEKWHDYADFVVRSDDAFGNLARSRADAWQRDLERLGRPVDPGSEWAMTPMEVNAYYSPPRNAIYFPAAILQPPFFDPEADPAVNYGGIAAVIGHEIGHGFDDQGRKSDGDGRLRDWWTSGDADRFGALTGRLGAQYAAYEPLPGMFIDPDFTMGENVGDLGGVAVALRAYELSLGRKPAPVLDGFTGVQRFFLSYAQIWRRKYRENDMRLRMSHDPHSPSEFRVNGIVRNMDDWYRAFGVGPDDDLYLPPDERVRIW